MRVRPSHQPSKARISRPKHRKNHCNSHVDTCFQTELCMHKTQRSTPSRGALNKQPFTPNSKGVNRLKQSLRLWVVRDVLFPSMVRRTRPLATIIIGHVHENRNCRATQTYKLQISQFHSGRLSIVSRKSKCISTDPLHRWRISSWVYPTCPHATNKLNL